MGDIDLGHRYRSFFYKKSANIFFYFRPKAIDLSFCDVNVYDEAESVVNVDQVSLFHFHDQGCSSTLETLILLNAT